MSLVPYNCSLVPTDSSKSIQKYSESDRSVVSQRVNRLIRRLRSTVQPSPSNRVAIDTDIAAVMSERFKKSANMARVASFNPANARAYETFLAMDFRVKRQALGLSDNFTEAGKVIEDLVTARRAGRGTMHQVLADIEMVGRNRRAYEAVKHLRKKYNIPQQVFDDITTRAVEIGWHPYLQQGMKLGPEGIMILQEEQAKLLRQLREFGMSQADIDLLGNQAGAVADTYMEVLEVAKQFNVNIDTVENINYFPRMFSDEALTRFAWEKESDHTHRIVNGDPQSIGASFLKGRNTFNFIVEDEILLDYILTNAEPDIYNTLGVKGIRDLFDDNRKLGEVLFNHLSENQLDRMIDSGLISKIPMNSSEVYEHLLKRYELPFEGIRELMAVDWGQAANLYRRQLESLAADSEMVNLMAKASIEGGWGVTEAQKLASPQEFRNFVQLSSVIPRELVDRFSINSNLISKVYVHPTVRDLFRAQFDIATNPNAMSVLGGLIGNMGTVFKRTALSTTGFIFRQLLNMPFQIWAAGGDLLEYTTLVPRAFSIMIEASRRGVPIHEFFSGQLNNTKAIYNGMTEQQLWRRLQSDGLLTEVMPWTGEDIARTPTNRSLKAHARYMSSIFEQYPLLNSPDFARRIFGQVGRSTGAMTGDVFYAFQLFNAEFENLARFATIKSLLAEGAIPRLRRAVVGNIRRPGTYDDAVKVLKDYFYFYDDLGRTDKFIGKYVVPFWAFISRNTFAQFRHLMRNPSKYLAYNRLYAALNQPARDEGEDLPQGALPDWARSARPLYWVRENDKGEEEYFFLPMTSIDPIADGQSNINNIGNGVLHAFGIWPEIGRTIQQAFDDLPWNSTVTNTQLGRLMSGTFPQWKVAYSAVSGRDIATDRPLKEDETGRQFSSFLGVSMSPFMRHTLENMVPLTRTLNRANPLGIFGRAPLVDTKTGELLNSGELSIFGVERTSRDLVNDYRSTWQRVSGFLGLEFREIDTALQMGFSEDQLRFEIRDGIKQIRKAERDLVKIQDPTRLRDQIENIESMKLLVTRLSLDLESFINWRESRGYESRAAIRVLGNQELSIQQLQTLTEQQELDLIQEVYGQN